MKTMWIEQAMSAGGKLSVCQYPGGGPIAFRAVMEWPAEQPVAGIGRTIIDAIENLNNALMEDAADEMVKKGVV